MKAAIALLLVFIAGFLLYEVLVGNGSTLVSRLQAFAGNAAGTPTPAATDPSATTQTKQTKQTKQTNASNFMTGLDPSKTKLQNEKNLA